MMKRPIYECFAEKNSNISQASLERIGLIREVKYFKDLIQIVGPSNTIRMSRLQCFELKTANSFNGKATHADVILSISLCIAYYQLLL